jgi:hypothetical protein
MSARAECAQGGGGGRAARGRGLDQWVCLTPTGSQLSSGVRKKFEGWPAKSRRAGDRAGATPQKSRGKLRPRNLGRVLRALVSGTAGTIRARSRPAILHP